MNPLEKERYIEWDEPNNRVIVSTALGCPGDCSFCYVYEIIGQKVIRRDNLGQDISDVILHDPRFKAGVKGTRILFGGFSDPFLDERSIRDVIKAVQNVGEFGNLFHVATRFSLRNFLTEWLQETSHSNVIVNYSVATFNKSIEPLSKSFDKKMIEAFHISQSNKPVAIYLAPILPGETVQYAAQIASRGQEAGLRQVMIGDLSLNEGIEEKLEGFSIHPTIRSPQIPFVLGGGLVRADNNIQEISMITDIFRDKGFEVFTAVEKLMQSLEKNLS